MKIILLVLTLCISFSSDVLAKKKRNEKIVYKYKKYQKFDFEAFSIGGDSSSPGDLSIRMRKQKGFHNMLPFRRNFNGHIRRAIETVR